MHFASSNYYTCPRLCAFMRSAQLGRLGVSALRHAAMYQGRRSHVVGALATQVGTFTGWHFHGR
jgi:hypothetical protein